MSARAFLVGLAIGSMAAMTPACGTTTKRCLRSNCAGCCDANDECQLGTQTFACGTDGRMCSTCQMGQTCGNGVCVGGAGGGAAMDGGGTGGGAAGGMPLCANCNGCCDTNGACRGGNTPTACGFGARACQNCQTMGQACSTAGTCVTFACPGCVLDGGQCAPGTSNLACGTDAGVCLQCATNQNCFNGQCVTAATCGPANCNGCCAGAQCIMTPTAAQCGSGGNACSACPGSQQCVQGACMGGAAGGSAGGAATGGGASGGGLALPCSPVNCGGCCDQAGTCQPGSANNACGNLGLPCQSCSRFCTPGLQVCF